jgi:iron complex outermembrane recepter protein
MMKSVLRLLIVTIALFATSSLSSANPSPDAADLFEMTLQDLMDATVTTAARHAQKISEAPAAISVVTAEDIRQLGAINLPEALQMVVGIYFGYTNSMFMLAGGIRGFHKLPANKIVLFIDGVPWSFEMYGVPGLYQLPISLEEIEKIEVLRGPGSSLYGPNAMFGVINVITKSAENTKGTLISTMAGEQDTLVGTLMQGGSVSDNFFYRLTAGWDQTDNRDYIAWENDPVQKYGRLNATTDYHIDDNSNLSFFAGYIDPKQQDVIVESAGPVDQSGAETFQTVLAYSSSVPKISFKTYLKDIEWSNGYSFGQKTLNFKMGSSGAEIQHEFKPVDQDTLVWGANIKQEYAEGPSIGGKHTHDMPGLFLDNTYRFTEQVGFNTGLRYDHHPNTGSTYSHRMSLLYSPLNGHHFRATWGSSFRNPDFVESYYSRYSPYSDNTYVHIFGQKDNDPEKATTYELGYNGHLSEKCLVTANIFYSELKDFVYFIQSGTPYLDPDVGGIVIPFPFTNIGDAEQYGAEVEIQYQVTQWLNALANYTYIDQEEKDDSVRQLLEMTPQHMASGQLRAKFANGISANLALHYKDSTDWREYIWASPEGNTMAGGHAGSYVYVNLRVAYAFKLQNNPTEVAISAYNLFDRGFDDYPLDTSDVARRVTGSFLVKF